MTGRQRLEGILARRGTDRPAWTTLVDDKARSPMPARLREMSALDFYRHVGCDILQFGNYGLAPADRWEPARLLQPAEVTATRDGDVVTRRTVTSWGTLTATSRGGHPLSYPVRSLDDLRVLRRLWEQSDYAEAPDARGRARRIDGLVGDDGLYLPALDPSPVQQLIEADIGLAGFYYFLHDHPGEVASLMEAMHRARLAEYEIVARCTPAPALIAVENTSTTLTSPAVYRRWTLPHVRDYAAAAGRWGKKLILHMCGLLAGLLEPLAETGMGGINALTPPPVGDCPFDRALDVLGDDLVILGGVFPPEVLHRPAATADDIARALDALYTPRIRRANFLLWVAVDGLPTPVEKLHAVRDWMARPPRR